MAAVAASCADHDDAPGLSDTGADGRLSFFAADMVPQYVDPSDMASRAGDPKTEAEKEIKTLHVFFFETDGSGNPAALADFKFDNFTPYQKIKGNVITVPDAAIESGRLSGLKIVAVANINGTDEEATGEIGTQDDPNMFLTAYSNHGKIGSGTRAPENPYMIESYEDLKKWVYSPKLRSDEGTPVTDLPKAGMPMTGESEVLTADLLNGNVIVQMKAMMARVDISVKLDPAQESLDGRLPVMTVDGYGVMNMPSHVAFDQPTVTDVTDEAGNPDPDKIEASFEVKLDNPVRIDKNTAVPPVFTYYTYENIQEPNGTIEDAVPANLKSLIAGYTDAEKEKVLQRWKPKIAKTGQASALVLTGTYTTHQNMTYKARFTIYMGSNTTDKFDVRRNHKYNNYITIHGLDYVRNSDDEAYTFDGRVNVVTDNPLYLAIVNERKVDAHASVRPMDVWLLLREPDPKDPDQKFPEVTHNSTVKVKIPDGCDWIRMVMVPRSEMQATDFKAGTGSEPYFTTDLFDRIDNKSVLSGHHDGAQCGREVTVNSTPTLNNSRSRIYFYIDENVDVTAAGYGDRTARIEIEYSNDKDGGEVRHRYLEIEQRGLVKVDATWGSGLLGTDSHINTWMEYYEEYLEHNDPLDKHEMPAELYSGLQWGLRGQAVKNVVSGQNGCLMYRLKDRDGEGIISGWNGNDPFEYSKKIIDQSSSLSTVKIYNDAEPSSAFHYVVGKNKRKSDGNLPDNMSSGWYMPGIRELEVAFVQHYVTFDDFRGNLYWSAACGTNNNVGYNEQTNNARATRVTLNGNTPTYIESTGSSAGAQDRNNRLRIRAFYK
ncbi:MAG: hypothetical protein K2G82_07115, partial [Paramuribaculum sp.]|nr:hypothetical protein [Paramuribaculum sp.]